MLNPIPTVNDLAADPVTHHLDDMIAPPGLTNFLGTCRVNHDLTAIGAVTFPPVSQGLTQTATLFLNDRLFASYGVPVTYEWRPDRVRRSAECNGWRISTDTVCVAGEQAVAIDIRITNLEAEHRKVRVALALAAAVTRSPSAWGNAESPSALNDVREVDGRLEFSSLDGGACSIQGIDVAGEVVARPLDASAEQAEVGIGGLAGGGGVSLTLSAAPGETVRFGYINAVGTDIQSCRSVFSRVAQSVPGAIERAKEFWNMQLATVFSPDNDQYSGSLPILETTDSDLLRLYWWSILGVVWFRRDFSGNFLGRTFDTLSPNYWATTTFIWDYSLSSLLHALLDPIEMRRQLLHWMRLDIHTHFGTSSLTGEPVGRWYSVNDYAMVRMVADYVRATGDLEFLGEEYAPGVSVYEGLKKWATAWKSLATSSPLADYGGIDNLLECVSSYTHEVASLNAANVWSMNTVADIAELLHRDADARELRSEAELLFPEVMKLYVSGGGYWMARQPDGSEVPVRHCYDFSVVGTTVDGYLDDTVKAEMIEFFANELRTSNWLHALSPSDPDASFSVRPDHQWNGAYPAWPADAGRALARLGGEQALLDWLPGLAKTANQGPMGQAHFVGDAVAAINGGARKAPPQLPYITDWSCSSSGAWFELIVDAIFGVEISADGRPCAGGAIAKLDPQAVLRGLRAGGELVDVRADGVVQPSAPGQPT